MAYMKFPPWWGYGSFLELHLGNFNAGGNPVMD